MEQYNRKIVVIRAAAEKRFEAEWHESWGTAFESCYRA